jgi:transporter family protein
MHIERWLVYALLSAAAAALVGIFAKIGMKGVDPTLATAVRSVVMTLFLLGVCTASGVWARLESLHGRAVAMIVLSGVAGAVSWLFYFKAIQLGPVSQVAPIDKLSMPLAVLLAVLILGERPSGTNWVGIALMTAGAYLAARPAGT